MPVNKCAGLLKLHIYSRALHNNAGRIVKNGQSQAGPKTFDVVWLGGSTTRYRHGERDIQIVGRVEVDARTREHLSRGALAARQERRRGARIRRGVVSPPR